jgi:hypothetical protein
MSVARASRALALLAACSTGCGSASSSQPGALADAAAETAGGQDVAEAALLTDAPGEAHDAQGEPSLPESGSDAPEQEAGPGGGEEGPAPTATCTAPVAESPAGVRDITFVAVADVHVTMPSSGPHCLQLGDKWNDNQNARLIEAINSIEQHTWQAPPSAGFTYSLEGSSFHGLRGVLIAGDVTNNGSEPLPGKAPDCTEWTQFRALFGLCGGDGALAYPVFEAYGNHDFPWALSPDPVYHPVIDFIHRRNRWRAGSCASGECPRFRYDAAASDPSGHYAFRWDDVWFVNLNLKPAPGILEVLSDSAQCPGCVRSTVPHSPVDFLDTLLQSLPKNASRQLVLMSHYGADVYPSPNRLPEGSLDNLCNTIAKHVAGGRLFAARPVPAWLSGHTHDAWAAGEFQCPTQTQVRIPWYSPGTALYGAYPSGRMRFSIFHLGASYLEVQSVAVDPEEPTGAWQTVAGRKLEHLASP